ncbi:LD-carboxypeptidase [Clostridium bowmanii]|uniref:S66 peptidase family protein n=1 Tax=Clostridium bowmanii TaxID=132925 RepID=UPI001C0CA66F|nr:LD-carboxypeptidase [Clostridium bowmanii]MBU3191729.1 LD-carboxypeptidase [Clostridium bowmanii]MCA1076042.1 LD-carboxypeptidase [Clostridium bowmanii]
MIKPKALKIGDTIGLVAPSSALRQADGLEKSISVLEEQGFIVVIGESCGKKYGYLSGSDELRAKDINRMFEDNTIDAVFCLKGGYGTPRILDKLDYDMIKENPKIFIGYSDITAIHIVLNQKCDLITFHGPMAASDMLGDFDEFSKKSYLNAITSINPLGEIDNPIGFEIKSMVPGVASGKIVGGNLSLIASTIGTPYEIDTLGKILFLEDVDEFTYSVDRMLTQLRLSGKLEDCVGIILGNFTNCLPQYEDFDHTLMEVFNDIILKAKKPTIYNFMAGHCSPKITIPLGAEVLLDADSCILTIAESVLH